MMIELPCKLRQYYLRVNILSELNSVQAKRGLGKCSSLAPLSYRYLQPVNHPLASVKLRTRVVL